MKFAVAALIYLFAMPTLAFCEDGVWDISGVKLGDNFVSVTNSIEQAFPEQDVEKNEGSLKTNSFMLENIFFGFKTITPTSGLYRGEMRGVINYSDSKSVVAISRLVDYSRASSQPTVDSIKSAFAEKYGKCTFEKTDNNQCTMIWTAGNLNINTVKDSMFFLKGWIQSLSEGRLSEFKVKTGKLLGVSLYFNNNKIVPRFDIVMIDFDSVNKSLNAINTALLNGDNKVNNEVRQKGASVKPNL